MTQRVAGGVGRWRPGAWQILLAAIAVGISVVLLADGRTAAGFQPPDLLTWVLTLIGAAAVIGARLRPVTALAVTGASFVVLTWRDNESELAPFLVTGLLFMVGSHCARRPAVLGLIGTALALLASAASRPPDLGLLGVIQSLAIFTAAWVVGRLTQGRREAMLALVAAAEHQAATERELAASERERTALAHVDERLRIARELHDVLAHSISVISVQSTVGEHLAAKDPQAARGALQTIGEVSRSSMTELRQMLTLLREDSTSGTADAPTYEPVHGLADLETLAGTYRSAGLPVQTETVGVPRPLSASADLCAYRIIQEALTNTLKHAGPTAATVNLEYRADELRVVITDRGRPQAMSRDGHGLVGMRERTSLLGGHFTAGPVAAGGFSVDATIPYERVA